MATGRQTGTVNTRMRVISLTGVTKCACAELPLLIGASDCKMWRNLTVYGCNACVISHTFYRRRVLLLTLGLFEKKKKKNVYRRFELITKKQQLF